MEVSKCRKIVEFPKVSIKLKNCKTFYEAQTASRLKEIIQPPSTQIQRLWNKHLLTEIYRNVLTFPFKALEICSSWASRNGAVQMFFFDTKQKHVYWKISKVTEVFSCVGGAYSMSSELRFIK